MADSWYAIIVAGGTGNRFGGPIPKQFLELNGKSVLSHSITQFFQVSRLQKLVIATHPDWIEQTLKIVQTSPTAHRISVVPGGKTRQDSCFNGLKALPLSTSPVLIHDAARPWISVALIQRVLQNAMAGHCVIPAIAATDSIVQMSNGLVEHYPDREAIGYVQTPQGFPLDVIRSVHLQAKSEGWQQVTDDGSLAHYAGYPVLVVPGERQNIKITEKTDLNG